MKVLSIERTILRKIGETITCHRPRCGEIVKRGEAIFTHRGNQFCSNFCAEAYYQGKRLEEIRK